VNADVNLFRISMDRLGTTVYQYDGEFDHSRSYAEFSSRSSWSVDSSPLPHALPSLISHALDLPDISPQILAKRRIFQIIDLVQTGNPQVFSTRPAFDGMKNLFSFTPLLSSGEAVFSSRPEGAINDYTVTIRLVAQVDSK
jgi:hypothetical protein